MGGSISTIIDQEHDVILYTIFGWHYDFSPFHWRKPFLDSVHFIR
jgi:hypothetical protein